MAMVWSVPTSQEHEDGAFPLQIIATIVIIIMITTSGECELYREACEEGVLPGETILAYHGVCRAKPCSKSKPFKIL